MSDIYERLQKFEAAPTASRGEQLGEDVETLRVELTLASEYAETVVEAIEDWVNAEKEDRADTRETMLGAVQELLSTLEELGVT